MFRSARIMAEPLAFENSAEADVVLKVRFIYITTKTCKKKMRVKWKE